MSGVVQCAWCASHDTQAGFDTVQCLSCGRQTTMTGEQTLPAEHTEDLIGDQPVPDKPEAEPKATKKKGGK
jgi:hypothetical protein